MSGPVEYLVRGELVDVNTGTVAERAIAIDDGEIVALEERPAAREIDAGYVTPGLIDAHTHVESSMVTLPRYGSAVVPKGVTSVIADPHEIGNVLGPEGVRAMIADLAHTPLKARFGVPSSVPVSPLQLGGATMGPDAVTDLLDEDAVVALAELVVNVPGAGIHDEAVAAKIRAARERGLTVDGHLPRVTGTELQEIARCVDTDHESITAPEAREKVDAGMRVYLREGSASRNLADVVGVVDEVDTRRLSLCTDDREIDDLVEEGGIDNAVRRAIELGVDPVEAVQMATVNTAEAYGLPFGRVEPGAPADLVLLSDLENWEVEHVFVDGVLDPTADSRDPPASELPADTVTFDPVDPRDLAIDHDGPGPVTVRVLDAVGGIQTEGMEATVPVEDGVVLGDTESDVLPAAVIERHGRGDGIGHGFVHRLDLDRGAVGSTVAHDAHNLIVVGATHESMAAVANHLRETGGGVAAHDPESGTTTALELPVAGLLSDDPLEEVKSGFEAVEAAADRIGMERSIMQLSFLALEVIPEYRLTYDGLVDVEALEYVDVVTAG